ncbi:1-(5-phosphoribosyl)-5-[(5-phosphoribosylamino)methylideneamino] imidazole-4-carboxamide isomerase [Acetitomaculum ruminis DSM 5522]|uniref:1-(5-phosphoribosyl)-5-[(5-phosphoribosylamino)methylideneamino] imidazole-4-carboxamide isomerase n=1 Tax=Acetitomaculum ruminis DSM 5522 TaxID=1120918 RepID=A0A1I0Z5K4_9FIRM|nr:phosphoribosylformimino-5-aminoimidazole carboxamide ribotide isomerase [Acetitomaculum ruminis]SFB20895.1 1-(5-phosphoribosyl)-5-[(5-phosphoribosylamino)methylideneamino] imidazole-4-carboxamide isomerase [Acetitomaculum ruminis DSM 5522]
MRFRPCIDIHDGKVKQIVGASLNDNGAEENFVSQKDSSFYASVYKKDEIYGGHVIMLNHQGNEGYEATKKACLKALNSFEYGLMAGGGINPDNAGIFLENKASHVIVTSYVFKDGKIDFDNLKKMTDAVGKKHLCLDLSCKEKEGSYYIVTDRWQKFTETVLNEETLDMLSAYCDEFLVHAAHVEGKKAGIDEKLVDILGEYSPIDVTYAGGIKDFSDIEKIRKIGKGKVDYTIGSALDLFGGDISYKEVVNKYHDRK